MRKGLGMNKNIEKQLSMKPSVDCTYDLYRTAKADWIATIQELTFEDLLEDDRRAMEEMDKRFLEIEENLKLKKINGNEDGII